MRLRLGWVYSNLLDKCESLTQKTLTSRFVYPMFRLVTIEAPYIVMFITLSYVIFLRVFFATYRTLMYDLIISIMGYQWFFLSTPINYDNPLEIGLRVGVFIGFECIAYLFSVHTIKTIREYKEAIIKHEAKKKTLLKIFFLSLILALSIIHSGSSRLIKDALSMILLQKIEENSYFTRFIRSVLIFLSVIPIPGVNTLLLSRSMLFFIIIIFSIFHNGILILITTFYYTFYYEFKEYNRIVRETKSNPGKIESETTGSNKDTEEKLLKKLFKKAKDNAFLIVIVTYLLAYFGVYSVFLRKIYLNTELYLMTFHLLPFFFMFVVYSALFKFPRIKKEIVPKEKNNITVRKIRNTLAKLIDKNTVDVIEITIITGTYITIFQIIFSFFWNFLVESAIYVFSLLLSLWLWCVVPIWFFSVTGKKIVTAIRYIVENNEPKIVILLVQLAMQVLVISAVYRNEFSSLFISAWKQNFDVMLSLLIGVAIPFNFLFLNGFLKFENESEEYLKSHIEDILTQGNVQLVVLGAGIIGESIIKNTVELLKRELKEDKNELKKIIRKDSFTPKSLANLSLIRIITSYTYERKITFLVDGIILVERDETRIRYIDRHSQLGRYGVFVYQTSFNNKSFRFLFPVIVSEPYTVSVLIELLKRSNLAVSTTTHERVLDILARAIKSSEGNEFTLSRPKLVLTRVSSGSLLSDAFLLNPTSDNKGKSLRILPLYFEQEIGYQLGALTHLFNINERGETREKDRPKRDIFIIGSRKSIFFFLELLLYKNNEIQYFVNKREHNNASNGNRENRGNEGRENRNSTSNKEYILNGGIINLTSKYFKTHLKRRKMRDEKIPGFDELIIERDRRFFIPYLSTGINYAILKDLLHPSFEKGRIGAILILGDSPGENIRITTMVIRYLLSELKRKKLGFKEKDLDSDKVNDLLKCLPKIIVAVTNTEHDYKTILMRLKKFDKTVREMFKDKTNGAIKNGLYVPFYIFPWISYISTNFNSILKVLLKEIKIDENSKFTLVIPKDNSNENKVTFHRRSCSFANIIDCSYGCTLFSEGLNIAELFFYENYKNKESKKRIGLFGCAPESISYLREMICSQENNPKTQQDNELQHLKEFTSAHAFVTVCLKDQKNSLLRFLHFIQSLFQKSSNSSSCDAKLNISHLNSFTCALSSFNDEEAQRRETFRIIGIEERDTGNNGKNGEEGCSIKDLLNFIAILVPKDYEFKVQFNTKVKLADIWRYILENIRKKIGSDFVTGSIAYGPNLTLLYGRKKSYVCYGNHSCFYSLIRGFVENNFKEKNSDSEEPGEIEKTINEFKKEGIHFDFKAHYITSGSLCFPHTKIDSDVVSSSFPAAYVSMFMDTKVFKDSSKNKARQSKS